MGSYTIPNDRRYTPSHLWVSVADGVATVGLTEHGQERYGKILYVGLPAIEAPVSYGMPIGYLQSAGFGLTHVFPPVQGTVVDVNTDLWASPDLVNDDPLGDGWLVRIEVAQPGELDELETPDGYRRILEEGGDAHAVEMPAHLSESALPAFLIDERRRVLNCNAAAEKFIGLTRRQLQHGPLCSELFGCHHDAGSPVTKSSCPGLCSMMNLEPVVDTEYAVTNAAGGETPVRATYTPVAAPGLPRRAIVTLTPLK